MGQLKADAVSAKNGLEELQKTVNQVKDQLSRSEDQARSRFIATLDTFKELHPPRSRQIDRQLQGYIAATGGAILSHSVDSQGRTAYTLNLFHGNERLMWTSSEPEFRAKAVAAVQGALLDRTNQIDPVRLSETAVARTAAKSDSVDYANSFYTLGDASVCQRNWPRSLGKPQVDETVSGAPLTTVVDLIEAAKAEAVIR